MSTLVANIFPNLSLIQADCACAAASRPEMVARLVLDPNEFRQPRIGRTFSGHTARGGGLTVVISQVNSIPTVMALDTTIISILTKFSQDKKPSTLSQNELMDLWISDPDLSAMTHRLNEIRAETQLLTLFILNASGDCIAAGKLPSFPVFIGQNYSKRQYFVSAKEGKNGRQFAVGRTDNVKAFFYSKPVQVSEKFMGAIVSRINVDNLTNLTLDDDTFVTDENGVVILANDSNILMKALPESKIFQFSKEDAESIYKQSSFVALELTRTGSSGEGETVQWRKDQHPYAYAKYTVKNEPITVHVLRNLKETSDIQSDRIWVATLASVTGILVLSLIFGSISYIRSMSHHRRESATTGIAGGMMMPPRRGL